VIACVPLIFGFKAGHSTDMRSMVLKETLAYYVVDGGSAFCTCLDATIRPSIGLTIANSSASCFVGTYPPFMFDYCVICILTM